MEEAQANLKRTAVEFLEAAETVAARAGQTAADPLDAVDTDILDLGDLEPAISTEELADLKGRLAQERLTPATIVDLVALARQVAAALAGM